MDDHSRSLQSTVSPRVSNRLGKCHRGEGRYTFQYAVRTSRLPGDEIFAGDFGPVTSVILAASATLESLSSTGRTLRPSVCAAAQL